MLGRPAVLMAFRTYADLNVMGVQVSIVDVLLFVPDLLWALASLVVLPPAGEY